MKNESNLKTNEAGALVLSNFNLNKVMTHVLPGLLFFDSGLWRYYDNEILFEKGDATFNQKSNEDFETFIKRVLTDIITQEHNSNEERLVSIDYAIYCGSIIENSFKLEQELYKHVVTFNPTSPEEDKKKLLILFVEWQKKYRDSSYVDIFNVDSFLKTI